MIYSDYIMDLEKHADIKDIYFGDEVWGHKDVLKIEVGPNRECHSMHHSASLSVARWYTGGISNSCSSMCFAKR